MKKDYKKLIPISLTIIIYLFIAYFSIKKLYSFQNLIIGLIFGAYSFYYIRSEKEEISIIKSFAPLIAFTMLGAFVGEVLAPLLTLIFGLLISIEEFFSIREDKRLNNDELNEKYKYMDKLSVYFPYNGKLKIIDSEEFAYYTAFVSAISRVHARNGYTIIGLILLFIGIIISKFLSIKYEEEFVFPIRIIPFILISIFTLLLANMYNYDLLYFLFNRG